MGAGRALGQHRVGSLVAALADNVEADASPPRRGFVSAYDRFRLHQLAAEELAACDAGDLAEALRLSELYEAAEKKALGL